MNTINPTTNGTPMCPKCGATMAKRTSKYGQFWGCTKYPLCKGTVNISGSSSTTTGPVVPPKPFQPPPMPIPRQKPSPVILNGIQGIPYTPPSFDPFEDSEIGDYDYIHEKYNEMVETSKASMVQPETHEVPSKKDEELAPEFLSLIEEVFGGMQNIPNTTGLFDKSVGGAGNDQIQEG